MGLNLSDICYPCYCCVVKTISFFGQKLSVICICTNRHLYTWIDCLIAARLAGVLLYVV